eukprot:scaffold29085_cov112-Isochrysis_galbana.AAC.2
MSGSCEATSTTSAGIFSRLQILRTSPTCTSVQTLSTNSPSIMRRQKAVFAFRSERCRRRSSWILRTMLTATTSNNAGREVGTLPVLDVAGQTCSADTICGSWRGTNT